MLYRSDKTQALPDCIETRVFRERYSKSCNTAAIVEA